MGEPTNVPEAYQKLHARLAKNAEGAPAAAELFEIFQILFTEEEARVGSQMPMLPSEFEEVQSAIGMDPEALRGILGAMADKGLVVDTDIRGKTVYMLAPPVIGFLEYTFMKRREDLPMKRLAELAHTYLHEHLLPVELEKVKTPRTRAVPYVSAFGGEMTSEVVPYEQARALIEQSGGGSLGACFCRMQEQLLGRGCDAPIDDICMGLGKGGEYLVKHGFARPASVEELLDKLDEAEKLGLVHTCDNVQKRPVFMCHCCGCCCHLLRTITEYDLRNMVAPSSFVATVDAEACTACGICADRCQIDAIDVDDIAQVNAERCIGCGVCVPECPTEAVTLAKRPDAVEPAQNMMDLYMRLAAEKDRLKHFIG